MFNQNKINFKQLLFVYFQIIFISLVINTLLYYIGKFFGGFSDNIITPDGQSVTIASIFLRSSISFPLLATIVFIAISKLSKNPTKVLRVLGYGFIAFMIPGPLLLENATFFDKFSLEIMHLVVGVQFIETIVYKYNKIITLTK
jgi:multisubunit Na+/H+ antiporter MnhF subunit